MYKVFKPIIHNSDTNFILFPTFKLYKTFHAFILVSENEKETLERGMQWKSYERDTKPYAIKKRLVLSLSSQAHAIKSCKVIIEKLLSLWEKLQTTPPGFINNNWKTRIQETEIKKYEGLRDFLAFYHFNWNLFSTETKKKYKIFSWSGFVFCHCTNLMKGFCLGTN